MIFQIDNEVLNKQKSNSSALFDLFHLIKKKKKHAYLYKHLKSADYEKNQYAQNQKLYKGITLTSK